MFENEDGALLVPEGEAGVCVRVKNRSHRRRVTVARGSEGWDALDEELSDGEWEWPSLMAWAHISYIYIHTGISVHIRQSQDNQFHFWLSFCIVSSPCLDR